MTAASSLYLSERLITVPIKQQKYLIVPADGRFFRVEMRF